MDENMDAKKYWKDIPSEEQIHEDNRKRTYDAYQDLDLMTSRNNYDLVNERARRSQENFDKLNNVALQALQNSVETSNLVGKQSVRHGGYEMDQIWNLEPNESKAESEIISSPVVDAIAAEVLRILKDNKNA